MKYCSSCGNQVEDNTSFCPKCGNPLSAQVNQINSVQNGGNVSGGAHIPDHFVNALLVTLFCCMPIGIYALVQSGQIKKKIAEGDRVGAKILSDQVEKSIKWGFISGIVLMVLIVLMSLGE